MIRVTAVLMMTLLQLAAFAGAEPAVPEHNVITVETAKTIRIAYDVKDDEWDAGIGKALYYVRGLYEAYRKQGVAAEHLHVSIVLHGPTVYWLLNDEAYQNHTLDPFSVNPNSHAIEALTAVGASIEACHSTMKGKGWKHDDLLPDVRMVHDGYTRLIDLQQRGYAYIRF